VLALRMPLIYHGGPSVTQYIHVVLFCHHSCMPYNNRIVSIFHSILPQATAHATIDHEIERSGVGRIITQ